MAIDVLLNNRHITRAELSELHNGAWRWALRQLDDDEHAADDVMQNVYVMLLEGRAHFDKRSSLKTWLYAVVRNACRRYRRNIVRQRLSLLHYLQSAASEPGTESVADAQTQSVSDALSSDLSNALRKLPSRQRDVIELTLLRDFTLAECAEILGLRIGSVRTHYHRGKENLRAQAENWSEDHD